MELNDQIKNGIGKGLHTEMILIKLQRTFDPLGHNVRLEIVECMSIKKPAIKWFKSYLSNITFFVTL